MPKLIRQFLSLCLAFLLTSCACCTLDQKITPIKEDWLCFLNHDPSLWAQGASNWFKTGHTPRNVAENANSFMKIKVPDFDRIVVNGSFRVQLVGNQPCNRLAIVGPYPLTRYALVDIRNRTLYLSQPKDCKLNLSNVIVRIGIRDLRNLTLLGCGNIEGRGILSHALSIYSSGSGSIMLMGNMNVQQINQFGGGNITLFGANTPCLNIKVIGPGNLNLCGDVGVQSIIHQGNGKIDIQGMNSPSLTIFATGHGLTQAVGVANLKKVSAYDRSQVYLYWVNASQTTITERNQARVGIAGTTSILTVDTKDTAQFEGQYLYAREAYVKTHESSHANINATQQLFLEANDNSSIYYFSRVKQLSTITNSRGIILPATSVPCCLNHPRFKGEL